MHSGICSTLHAQGIADTLTIFIGRSSLAGGSYPDLAYLDLAYLDLIALAVNRLPCQIS